MQIHVLEYLDRSVARHPEKVALVDEASRYTFAAVSRRVRGIAAAVAERTGGARAPIAVYLAKSAEAVMAQWGIAAAGCFYAPLDVKSPAARTANIMETLQPAAIMTDEDGATALSAIGIAGDRLLICTDIQSLDLRTPAASAGTIDTDPLYVIFTSGSTGTPKGVVVAHRGVIDYIDWAVETFSIGPETIIGSQSPLYFDNSTLDLYLCLAAGATLVIVPEKLFAFPQRLMEWIAAEHVNFVFWVPSMLVQVANLDILRTAPCRDLRKVLFAGEVMPNKQLNYWRRALPQAMFANLYGPTEITVDCTYYIVDREFADHEPLPIGFPCRNSDVLILNDGNEPTRTGEHGELCVRGSSLAHGYWNDPEKTAAAFTQNPLNAHYPERIYRTGDLVYRNERGEIMFVGRKDHQIKHRGFRIELGEIELAAGSTAAVRNACALYDDVRQEICLFYEADAAVTPADVRKHLSTVLPKYMIPTVYFRLDELPKNANGKIDRRALAARLAANSTTHAGSTDQRS